MKFRRYAILWGILLQAICVACAQGMQEGALHIDAPKMTGDIWGIHDPSLIKAGSMWYVFSTGERPGGGQLPIVCSKDLRAWSACGTVFAHMPAWIPQRLSGVKFLWAPDITHVDGQYRLYYAYSLDGKNTSGIALATNQTLDPHSPDYRWVDCGVVLESRKADNFNAIDPNFVRDAEGRDWLVFGSFWSGIKMRRLGPDGKLSAADTHLYALAERARPDGAPKPKHHLSPPWQAIEGPFLVHHGSFYYLFTSWDHCCRGAESNYRTMVGRSSAVTGPYVDRQGRPLLQGGGTQVLAGNAQWAGPGGESIWMAPAGGTDLIAFHAYDRVTGRSALQIAPIQWTDDWPQIDW